MQSNTSRFKFMFPYPEKYLIPKVAKGVKGFKSKGKFFKIMGPKGEDRKAFQILEVRDNC